MRKKTTDNNQKTNLIFDGRQLRYYGNLALMNLKRTAFLSSDMATESVVKLSEEWALEQAKNNCCVVSGFLSKAEKKVLNILLKRGGYIIMVMANQMFTECPDKYKQAMEERRILFLSTFDAEAKKVTKANAEIRNKQVIDLSNNLVIGCVKSQGIIEKLLSQTTKPYTVLDPPSQD